VKAARTPAGSVLAAWSACYLFLLVVPYHSEIRYRSALVPAFLALAAAGAEALGERPLGRPARVAGLVGVAVGLAALAPYLGPLARAAHARFTLRGAHAAVVLGDLSAARAAARRASAQDPQAAAPWLRYGRWLSGRGFPGEAVDACEEALRRRPGHPAAVLALPVLLRAAGFAKRADRALAEAQALEATIPDALEIAWRELPPPRTDVVRMGQHDLGALRGFYAAEDGRRWTRPRAWLRIRPLSEARVVDVRLVLGAPPPAPVPSPTVTLLAAGNAPVRLAVDAEVRAHGFSLRRTGDGPLLLELKAPAWSRSGGLVDRGVLVERLEVRPTAGP
jgi:tetratricopeptide (TPR) repeat protein